MGNDDGLVLILDCDGVIVDSVKLIEDAVAKINYRGSKRYIECIKACAKRKEDEITAKYFWEDHETYDCLIEELRNMVDHYVKIKRITFDEVAEEVFSKYKNRINYDEIYQEKNLFPGVVEKIREFYYSGYFQKIYICTHCNSPKEIEAKKKLFRRCFNDRGVNIETVFIPYHDVPYIYDTSRYFENLERKRTNKANYFFAITDEYPIDSILVDDGREICDEAELIGVKTFHRDCASSDPLHPFTEMEEFLKARKHQKKMSF